jgi:hypothetical protein
MAAGVKGISPMSGRLGIDRFSESAALNRDKD